MSQNHLTCLDLSWKCPQTIWLFWLSAANVPKISDFFFHKKELGWKCPKNIWLFFPQKRARLKMSLFSRRVGLKMSLFPSAASAENVPLLSILLLLLCMSRWSLWGAERGWADVGLWVAVCFLAKISSHRPTCKTTFARLTQSQAIPQSFRVFISFRSRTDTTLFHFSKLFFIQNYRFLYHGDQKISWWTSMQVAGSQLRNPPVKFRQERWLHIWRSISIQHVQMEAGLNSDPGNDSFSDKIRDAKHVDRSTH